MLSDTYKIIGCLYIKINCTYIIYSRFNDSNMPQSSCDLALFDFFGA